MKCISSIVALATLTSFAWITPRSCPLSHLVAQHVMVSVQFIRWRYLKTVGFTTMASNVSQSPDARHLRLDPLANQRLVKLMKWSGLNRHDESVHPTPGRRGSRWVPLVPFALAAGAFPALPTSRRLLRYQSRYVTVP
jgi:hypothetical protein